MPRKGTKKVSAHTRSKTLFQIGNVKVKDVLNTTHVKEHYRSKPKKKR